MGGKAHLPTQYCDTKTAVESTPIFRKTLRIPPRIAAESSRNFLPFAILPPIINNHPLTCVYAALPHPCDLAGPCVHLRNLRSPWKCALSMHRTGDFCYTMAAFFESVVARDVRGLGAAPTPSVQGRCGRKDPRKRFGARPRTVSMAHSRNKSHRPLLKDMGSYGREGNGCKAEPPVRGCGGKD